MIIIDPKEWGFSWIQCPPGAQSFKVTGHPIHLIGLIAVAVSNAGAVAAGLIIDFEQGDGGQALYSVATPNNVVAAGNLEYVTAAQGYAYDATSEEIQIPLPNVLHSGDTLINVTRNGGDVNTSVEMQMIQLWFPKKGGVI